MRQAITKFLQYTYKNLKSKHSSNLQDFHYGRYHRPACYSQDIQQSRPFSSSEFLFKQSNIIFENQGKDLLESYENEENEEGILYRELLNRSQLISTHGHQVLVIQPYIKWGQKRNHCTTPELMMDEAVALIDSLPKWRTVDKLAVPLESTEKKQLFGKGKLEELRETISRNLKISAVFISLDFLRGIQKRYQY